jgi:hypothetical protein
MMSKTELYKGTTSLNEDEIDITQYERLENVKVSNNVMEQIVLAVNNRISQVTGLCTYIIDTHEVRKYKHKTSGDEVYRCRFMVLKHGGFPYAFAVSSDIRIMNDPERVNWNDFNMQATLRTLGVSQDDANKVLVDAPIEFVDEQTGKIDATKLIIAKYMKEVSDKNPVVVVLSLRTQPLDTQKPTNTAPFTSNGDKKEFQNYNAVLENELNYVKNTSLIEKKILSPEEMYGRPKIVENISSI